MRRLILLFALALTACQPHAQTSKETHMNQPTVFYIGQKGEELTSKAERGRVDKQPMGVNFNEVNWPVKASGKVRFEHGSHSFEIPGALGLMGIEDFVLNGNEGIQNFSLDFVLTSDASPLMHQDARDRIFIIFKYLQDRGWKRYIDRSLPRLKGKESWSDLGFGFGDYSSLDTAYLPNMDEWMRLKDYSQFMFYADDAILTIKLARNSQRMDVNQVGEYFMTMDIVSLRDDLRQWYANDFYSLPDDEKRTTDWRIQLPAGLEKAKKQRLEEEAKLRKQGYHIDETYQDPPIPKEFLLDPKTNLEYGVKPTAKVGAPCPITGMWYCKGVSSESGIYLRKGDPMPGQSYSKEQRDAMEWHLLKASQQS